MTKRTLKFAPCILSDTTDTDAEGRFKDSDRVRWHNGLPEKIGGWQALQVSAADATVRGICRALHDWTELDGQQWVAIGTHKRLYVYSNGALSNITPSRTSTTPSTPFSTDTGGAYDPDGGGDASYFSVQDTGHNASEGDIVVISGASAIGGITPDGSYEIRSITDANNYVLRHSSVATSTVSGGGGSPTILYELAAGNEVAAVGTGYGLGTWSSGAFGTPRSGSSQILPPRVWSLVNWGEDLLASPYWGGVYLWDVSAGVARATLVTQAPQQINRLLLSPEDRHLIALGASSPGGTSNFDPLLVRWCDQEDYTDWTATAINTAGDKRLDGGSFIITGIKTNYGILIFTDKTLHLMTFIGPPDTFSIRQIADNVSLMGPNAVIDVRGVPYWMGQDNFYYFDGAVQILPCEVWSKVFGDTQVLQGYQVYASLNADYAEIRWEYPSATSDNNSRYVCFNYKEGGWYRGTMERSAMHEKATLFAGKPYGTDCGGTGISDDNVSTLFIHEQGNDAAGAAMNEYLETYDIHFPGADAEIFLRAIYPDFKELVGDIQFRFSAKKRPHGFVTKTKIFDPVTSETERVGIRMRGTQIWFRVSSNDTGVFWRMGDHDYDFQPDGEGR